MAGPEIITGNIAHLRPDRVPVNVTQQLQKMTVFLDENALVASTKQLPICVLSPIVTLGVNTVNVSHRPRQVSDRCLYKKMIMVRHQAKCSNPEIKHLGGFLQ
jgi:hypothetical protein